MWAGRVDAQERDALPQLEEEAQNNQRKKKLHRLAPVDLGAVRVGDVHLARHAERSEGVEARDLIARLENLEDGVVQAVCHGQREQEIDAE